VGRALISARSAESFSFVTPARNRRAVYRRFIKDNWNRERVFASFGVPTFDVKYPFPSPPLFLPPITGANYKRSRTRLMPSPEFCDVRGVSAARMFSETGNTGIFPLPLPLPPPSSLAPAFLSDAVISLGLRCILNRRCRSADGDRDMKVRQTARIRA